MTDAIDSTTIEQMRKFRELELRARRLVDSSVSYALSEAGEPDDYGYKRFAYDVATLATTMLLKQVYEGDRELAALRIERDHYKKVAEAGFNFIPLQTKVPV